MNFTTQDYRDFIQNVELAFRVNPSLKIEDSQRVQQEFAFILSEIYSDENPCISVNTKVTEPKLVDLKSKMGSKFFDFSVVKETSCAINAVFHPIKPEQGAVGTGEIIRESLTGLSRIGSDSAFGYALVGGAKGVSDLFVIKVPSGKSNGNDLYTERFVTEFGTNEMRQLGVPNFAMTYGHIVSSRPIVDTRNRKVVNYLSSISDDKVPYLVYENISNSVGGDVYTAKADEKQFLGAYLQIMFALSIASEKKGFTHQDLHPGNWLARYITGVPRGEKFQIPYKKDDGSVIYLKTDMVATIIDFGLSTIEHKDKVHGNIEQESIRYGRYSDIVWPLHDAYKLLMFSALYARNTGNMKVFNKAKQIFRFFSSEDINYAINNQFDLRYTLPYIEKTKNFTIRELINFIIQKCDGGSILSATRDSGKVLECESCNLVSLKDAKRKIDIPDSFLEIFDTLPYIVRKYGKQYQTAIVKNFPYSKAKNEFIDIVDNLLAKLTDIETPNLSGMFLFSDATVSALQNNNYALFSRISDLEKLKTNITVGNWVAVLFQDEPLKTYLNAAAGLLNDNLAKTCQLLSQAVSNYYSFQSRLRTPEAQGIIAANPKLYWLVDGADKIVMLQRNACVVNNNRLEPKEFVMQSNSKTESSKPDPVALHYERKARILNKHGL